MASEEVAPLLQNPLRNGALLRDVLHTMMLRAGQIVPAGPRAPFKTPKTIPAARQSILLLLRMLDCPTTEIHTSPGTNMYPGSHPSMQERLEVMVEQILRGERRTIWGLLTHLRMASERGASVCSFLRVVYAVSCQSLRA